MMIIGMMMMMMQGMQGMQAQQSQQPPPPCGECEKQEMKDYIDDRFDKLEAKMDEDKSAEDANLSGETGEVDIQTTGDSEGMMFDNCGDSSCTDDHGHSAHIHSESELSSSAMHSIG